MMDDKESRDQPQWSNRGASNGVANKDSEASSGRHCMDGEVSLPTCRVCHCAESDTRGNVALEFLGITPPFQEPRKSIEEELGGSDGKGVRNVHDGAYLTESSERESGFVEFVSPKGEVFVCSSDIEMGSCRYHDTLMELGCCCKNDLALVHYACALKWFVNHGSIICEICGSVAKNVRTSDVNVIVVSLKEYKALRERTVNGEPSSVQVQTNIGIDPDAVAAIRRQRLSEISLWFGPHKNHNSSNENSSTVPLVVSEQPSNIDTEEIVLLAQNPATKWVVGALMILLASFVIAITLASLLAPHAGKKKIARSGLHIILGGLCALAVVAFFRNRRR